MRRNRDELEEIAEAIERAIAARLLCYNPASAGS
jgi:hypothetical protein